MLRQKLNSPPIVQMFGVSKSYSNCSALQEISLSIRRGEFVFLTGPSGAGKTTLLRLVTAAERPSRGQILVNGKNLTRLGASALPLFRRQMGIVFQDYQLMPRRTAFENVAIALRIRGISRREVRKKAWQALQWVGLGEKKDLYPRQLSGGEQQRAAIARAVVDSPLILVADEPTGNLDHALAGEIVSLFEELNRRGTTVLFATHARELVERVDKRAVVLHQGKIVES